MKYCLINIEYLVDGIIFFKERPETRKFLPDPYGFMGA
jgi:hypothetical protein